MTFELSGVCPLLGVFDMPAALAFYRDVLGFAIVQSSPPRAGGHADDVDWVWLRRDATELMLNTAYDPDAVRPPVPDAVRVAAHGDTVLYIGCREIEAVYRHLTAAGVDVKPPVVTHYGMKQLSVTDPDGFGVCFQWRADSSIVSAPRARGSAKRPLSVKARRPTHRETFRRRRAPADRLRRPDAKPNRP